MRYQEVIPAVFLERPNRFIALVLVNGQTERVHVKNTGRCRELLIAGCTVYLAAGKNPSRKTKYDLIAVEKVLPDSTALLINIDAQAPNAAAEEWLHTGALFPPAAEIRREVTYGNSRFDFCITHGETTAFLEVKGVTLEQNGVVSFPDAPTERGTKHLLELAGCRQKGYEAYLLFVVQLKGAEQFRPNDSMDPAFGKALRHAVDSGVQILAMDCVVTPDSMTIDQPVPIILPYEK